MNTLPVLIRREFWEHRVLWIAPLIVSGFLILLCLVPGFEIRGFTADDIARVSHTKDLFAQIVRGVTLLQFLVAGVVAFFYLSDCLYAERKDRSILFWKSLPVSDSTTVLSKVLVALLILPAGVYLLSAATSVIVLGILFVRFHGYPIMQLLHWDVGSWLRLNGVLILDLIVLGLWYAPLVGYQLLTSAWAKSSVFIWTVLPPLLLIVGERLAFGTWHIGEIIGTRLAGLSLTGEGRSMGDLVDNLNMLPHLMRLDLWIGVALAAAFVFGAIRIRRYRDDS
jgi:ABC-2 type transport system permease protein